MKRLAHAAVTRIFPACLGIAALATLTGCPGSTTRLPTSQRPSLGAQLKQQDEQLVGQRFRTLLDFENAADTVFVATPGRHSLTPHTGGGAFESTPSRDGQTALQVKIDPLLYGAKLPGKWTLIGAYVRPQSDAKLTTMLLADGQIVAQQQRRAFAGEWVFASVELTSEALAAKLGAAESVRLAIDAEGKSITIDDVLLVDNDKKLVERPAGLSPAFEVRRHGFMLHVQSDGGMTKSVGLQDGWVLDEATPLRVRLRSPQGARTTLYPDGREIVDGTLRGAPAAASQAHDSPADVVVDEATGRLDQATDGDAQNDGYNEVVGAYQIVAKTPRVSIRITPHGAPAVSPVLEITGLPAGTVSAHVEGRLIETAARTPDGTAIVLLPLKIERATTITVKVE